MNNYDRVKEFHETFKHPVNGPITTASLGFRLSLIQEEWAEVNDACNVKEGETIDKAHLLKELSDLLYVTYGMAVNFGLPLQEAFEKVHESNMSKLTAGKPKYDDNGKVLKGSDYIPPHLEDLFDGNTD